MFSSGFSRHHLLSSQKVQKLRWNSSSRAVSGHLSFCRRGFLCFSPDDGASEHPKHVGFHLMSYTKILLFVTCERVGVIIYDFSYVCSFTVAWNSTSRVVFLHGCPIRPLILSHYERASLPSSEAFFLRARDMWLMPAFWSILYAGVWRITATWLIHMRFSRDPYVSADVHILFYLSHFICTK
jgi:hypothetical protein